ncbi:MAG: hypothetical protein WBY44_23290 [Bryobacteraceae bacterium]|jgi:hypothetical protein
MHQIAAHLTRTLALPLTLVMASLVPLSASTIPISEDGPGFSLFPDLRFLSTDSSGNLTPIAMSYLSVGATAQTGSVVQANNGTIQMGAGPYSATFNSYPAQPGTFSGGLAFGSGGVDEANLILKAGGAGATASVQSTAGGGARAIITDILNLSDTDTVTISGVLDGNLFANNGGDATLNLSLAFYDPSSIFLSDQDDEQPFIYEYDGLSIVDDLISKPCTVDPTMPCTQVESIDNPAAQTSTPFSLNVDLPAGDTLLYFALDVNARSPLNAPGGGASADFSDTLHLHLSLPDDGTVATSQSGLLPVTIESTDTPEPAGAYLSILGLAGVAIAAWKRRNADKVRISAAHISAPKFEIGRRNIE